MYMDMKICLWLVDADKASMGGVGTSDEQNGTQAAGEGLSMAGDGDQGEEEQRKSMSNGTGVYIL